MASEMQRQGFDIPLLIGGATTSRAHTAVKVDGKYDGPVVWVKDASRSVPTVASLLHEERRTKLLADVKADYDSLRARHAAKHDRPMVTLEEARANATPDRLDAATGRPGPGCCSSRTATSRRSSAAGARPSTSGSSATTTSTELRRYIDWQPFFNAWEMKGSFPDILNNPTTGPTARKLYDDAQAMLDRLTEEKWLTAHGIDRAVPGQQRRRRHRGLPHRAARRAAPACCPRCASRASTATGVPNRCALRLRRAHGAPGCATTSAPSR